MKVERVKITDQEKMAIVKEIRMQVFVVEQNVPYEEDWDEEEELEEWEEGEEEDMEEDDEVWADDEEDGF